MALLFAACGGADKSNVTVPKDAAVVIHLNMPALSSKLSWSEIKASAWFKELSADSRDSLAQQLLDDPKKSGIDTEAEMVFFLKRLPKGAYMALEGILKDPAAFEAFNKQLSPEATASKVGDVTVMKTQAGVATYKDNRFIYIIDAPYVDAAKGLQPSMDENGGYQYNYQEPTRLSTDTLVQLASQLYELKGDASLSSDNRFTSLLKEPGDLHLWMNAGSLYNGMLNTMPIGNFKMLTEGNINAGTLHFDDGKITASSRFYYNEELGKLYETYKMKNLDADALSNLPTQDVVAAFAMNYPPEGLGAFIKAMGVDGIANGFLNKFGYSIEEFIKANKGDLILAVSDFKAGAAPNVPGPNMMPGAPEAKVLFATSVNDKPSFEKLILLAEQQLGGLKNMAPDVKYTLSDKWFVLGNDQQHNEQFASGKGGNKPAFVSKISGHPIGGYINLKSILQTTTTMTKDSSAQSAMNTSANFWDDVVMYGGELKDKSMTGYFEINLVDKNTNSLKQLNKYFEQLPRRPRGF